MGWVFCLAYSRCSIDNRIRHMHVPSARDKTLGSCHNPEFVQSHDPHAQTDTYTSIYSLQEEGGVLYYRLMGRGEGLQGTAHLVHCGA